MNFGPCGRTLLIDIMPTLREFKKRIRASKNIASITKAMQLISVNKVRKSQETTRRNTIYVENLQEMRGTGSSDSNLGIFKNFVLVLAPQRGLCGSLVNNLAADLYRKAKLLGPETDYILVGRKAYLWEKYINRKALAFFDFGLSLPTFSKVRPLTRLVVAKVLESQKASVCILYPKFYSFQKVESTYEPLYPLKTPGSLPEDFLTDEDPNRITRDLDLYYLEGIIYQKVLEAYLSENAARMVAMLKASQNAQELNQDLTLIYNKQRQKEVTTEIIELKGGVASDRR